MLLGAVVSVSACAPIDGAKAWLADEPYEPDPQDPWETSNRLVYQFNDTLDKALVKPVAKGYDYAVPIPVKDCVRNFFSNLKEPGRFMAHVIRWNRPALIDTTVRFVSNTVLGAGGCFDAAAAMHVPVRETDLGLALQAYDGVEPAPYLVLPLYGPSTVLTGLTTAVEITYFDPLEKSSDKPDPTFLHFPRRQPFDSASEGRQRTITVIGGIARRADFLGVDEIVDEQLDPYAFVRDSYLQRRALQAKALPLVP